MDRARLYRLSSVVSGGLLASVALVLISRNGVSVIPTVLLISGIGTGLSATDELLSPDSTESEPGPVSFRAMTSFTGLGLVGAVLFVVL